MAGTLSVTEAVGKVVNNIKKKYGRRTNQEDQLLGCRSEKLVWLELVKKERLQANEQRGNKYGSEDSSVTRTPLAYADLFKVEEGKKEIKMILIEGDAGIGKTTFCIAVCEDWADGKIFQDWFSCTLAATYLVCESNLRCYMVPYDVPNAWFVWISFVHQFWRHLLILSFLAFPGYRWYACTYK